MGFSGHLVFARSERPLLEAPLFGSTGPGLREDVHEWQSRPDGWQTLRLEQGILDNAAALLVEEPEELDDVSLWTATPEFQEAIGHKRAELDAEVPNDAEGALMWASAAGVQTMAQQPRIEDLLRAQEIFVEELFDALLDELGFPEAAHSAPQP
ncbi:hypothetical protein PV379_18870 [Streptomyces caniscabiei]|uniref:hypothetical protein n=1 Tax=Streptomyces caniscabiei TaxID=2746961 RepID=UPI0029B16E68|nr:hypothetical protein [Streptomyces caniscabiei]MDX2605072.1 hypothetical protein [Streptomyces caniscabiei]MDX2735538.1 hypothetical protein [Streptomyces caniscabiei]MDX2779365.1 hypothetical protein [Streptomyces caniscabiei]